MGKFCLISLILAGWLISGCSNCEWVSSKPLFQSPEILWNTVYQVIAKRYDILKASTEKRELETDWRRQMSLHYLESYQEKAFVKIEEYQPEEDFRDTSKPLKIHEEVASNRPAYVVKVCVLREQNRNIDNPNVASEAQWFPIGNNPEEAKLLISFIIARLAFLYPEIQDQEKMKDREIQEPDPLEDLPLPK